MFSRSNLICRFTAFRRLSDFILCFFVITIIRLNFMFNKNIVTKNLFAAVKATLRKIINFFLALSTKILLKRLWETVWKAENFF